MKKTKDTNQNHKMTFGDFDKLNLKGYAKNLFNIMESGVDNSVGEEGSYPISLNAEFGNGKTTFLKMFQHFIEDEKSQNYNIIFINAWESDFYGEPIISILSELITKLKKEQSESGKEGDNNKAINKIERILGKIVNHKTTRLIGNVANLVVAKKTGFNIKEAINSCNKKNDNVEIFNQDDALLTKAQNVLTELNQRKEAIKEIKEFISDYTEDKRLLIIIDELDRARPDYAVHFLEDMKHFFDIKNVVFLAGVNRKQMESTVKCLYGQNLDFDGYYKKFFKQEIDLPDPYKEARNLIDSLIKETKVKFYRKGEPNSDPISREYRVENTYLSCKMSHLTLREINQFITIFEMILSHDKSILKWVFMDCYSFFICLFLKKKEIFNKILDRNFTVDQFCEFIKNDHIPYMLSNETQGSEDIKFKNNHLLGIIACSLIKSQEAIEQEKKRIEKTFPSIKGHIENIIQHPDNFDFNPTTYQPAFRICKKIKECQSAF